MLYVQNVPQGAT